MLVVSAYLSDMDTDERASLSFCLPDSKCEPSLGGITGSYEIVAVSA